MFDSFTSPAFPCLKFPSGGCSRGPPSFPPLRFSPGSRSVDPVPWESLKFHLILNRRRSALKAGEEKKENADAAEEWRRAPEVLITAYISSCCPRRAPSDTAGELKPVSASIETQAPDFMEEINQDSTIKKKKKK